MRMIYAVVLAAGTSRSALSMALVAILTSMGCSWIVGFGTPRVVDGGMDALDGSGSAMPRCNPDSPFGEPTDIKEVNTIDGSEEGAYLLPNELTMYFSKRSSATDPYEIFMASRSSRTAQWGNIVSVQGVNIDNEPRQPSVTEDGSTMYASIHSSNRTDSDVGIAMRMNTGFTKMVPAARINDTARDDVPGTVLPNNSALWFASNRNLQPTGSHLPQFDLFRAARSGGQFGAPEEARGVKINDPDTRDSNPVVTPDELTLYFASEREGGLEIWMAKRRSVAAGFDEPMKVNELISADAQAPSWVSADGCVLYIIRARGGPTTYDIWQATRGM